MQLSETYEKKKKCGRPVFLEELEAARNFSKVSLHLNKIPNTLRQILQTYSEICIFHTLCNYDVSTKTVCACIIYFVSICKDDFY